MSHKTLFGSVLAFTVLVASAPAQWIAYNDHYQGPASSNNCTFWNVFGTQYGAPGNAGYLKNIATGEPLPAGVSIISNGATGGNTSGQPNAGTPAYATFSSYIDFGSWQSGSTLHSIMVQAGQSVSYVFTNLDLTKLYSFKATAIRGDSTYTRRWSLCEIIGANSFSNAHTPGVLIWPQGTNLAPWQAAVNSGYNAAGELIDWERIAPSYGGPGVGGTFTVQVTMYTNWIPAGYPGGPAYGDSANHGYAFNCFRLEEVGACTPAPVAIAGQPASQNALVGDTATLFVNASGCPVFYQWFKNGAPIADATNASVVFPTVQFSDAGEYSVIVSNEFNAVLSTNATLKVSSPLIRLTQLWRYNWQGQDLGTAWKEIDYDDSSWLQGAGVLAQENNANIAPLIHTTLPLSTPTGQRIITYYFRTRFQAPEDLSGLYFTFSNLIDDGAVFYLNGTEIFRTNMPNGEFCASTCAGPQVSDAVFATKYIAPENFVPGENVLAVEVHQDGTNSSDIVFGLTLQATPVREAIVAEQPASQLAPPGGMVVLSARVLGQEPMYYQWYKGTARISDSSRVNGAHASSVKMTGLIAGDQSDYKLAVSNAFGWVTSQVATLTIGNVAAWGESTYNKTDVPTALSNAVAVGCGWDHSVALLDDGTVLTWGRNNYNQQNIPANLAGVAAIAVGGNHTAALRGDGTVVCWGRNNAGQSTVPPGLRNVVKLAAGDNHNVALLADGTLVAWGDNSYGQIGFPAGLNNIVDIAANHIQTLLLRGDGTVLAYGRNNVGQCNVPPGLTDVVSIAVGDMTSFALRRDGSVVIWGDTVDGALLPPANVTNIVAISAGQQHCLALRADGTLLAWGTGSSTELLTPPNLNNIRAFATFESHNLVIAGNPCTPRFAQPASQSVTAGADAFFLAAAPSVGSAAGFALPAPTTCQWRFNGVDLPGETNFFLRIPNVTMLHDGEYSFVLGNACGTVASAWARLAVTTPGNMPYYSSDFENGAGPEWSSQATDLTPNGQRRFLGQFGKQTVSLSLSNLPPHTNVTVSFDLFLIRTWDGNATSSVGPDYWTLAVRNGPALLNTTFYNGGNQQSFPQNYPASYPGGTGAAEINTLGFTATSRGVVDAVYRLTYSFAHTDASVILDFIGACNEGLANESWGLDNVSVTLTGDTPNPWSQLTTQPQAQVVQLGGTATFNVGVSGPGPISYQWRRNGTNLVDGGNIAGAQSATLSVQNVLPADFGDYDVLVSNTYGSTFSRSASLSCTPPNFKFVQQAGGTSDDQAQEMAIDAQGNFFVTGSFFGTATFGNTNLTSVGGEDAFVAKYDGSGNLLWLRQIGGTGTDRSYAVATDPEQNCFVSGLCNPNASGSINFGGTNVTGVGNSDIFLAKYNPDGVVLWVRIAGSTGGETGHRLATDTNGNCYMVGEIRNTVAFGPFQFTSAGNADAVAVKYDPDGTVVWATSLGGTGLDSPWGVAVDNQGNCFVGGYYGNTLNCGVTNLPYWTAYDGFLVKLNSSGAVEWARQATGLARESFEGMACDNDGNCIVGAYTTGTCYIGSTQISPSGTGDAFLCKFDPDGNLVWLRPLNCAAGGGEVSTVAVDTAGNIYASGNYYGGLPTQPNRGDRDGFIARFDPKGVLQWMQSFGGTGEDWCKGIKCTHSGEVCVAGWFNTTATFGTSNLTSRGGADIFLARLDPWLPAPIIYAQPQSQTVPVGADVTFALAALGEEPLTYQWQCNGTNLPGATTPSLLLTNVGTNLAGAYRVVITNPYGCATSAVATLVIAELPRITTQPRSRAGLPGGSAILQVAATSATPKFYQWYRDGLALPGQTNAFLILASLQAADFGVYVVTVSNTGGTVVSDPATLSLAVSPSISPPIYNHSTFRLTFTSQFGPSYQVAYKNNLNDPEWTVLTTLTGTGMPLTATDNATPSVSRFYRVTVK